MMTMKKSIYFLGLCTLLLCSCSKSKEFTVKPSGESKPVQMVLKGGIANSKTMESASTSASLPPTRAVINSDYNNSLSVYFARIDQEESSSWPSYTTVSAPLEATLATGSGNRTITFTQPQFYSTRNTNNSTRLVGWYPQGVWSAGSLTFNIDGVTDIMLTQELTGDKSAANQFGQNDKVFTFSHKLTRLNIKAYATDGDAMTVWGKIAANGIVLKNQATTCTLTLPSSISFGDEKKDLTLPAKQVADDAAITYPLTLANGKDHATECGYAMIQPASGSTTLTLTVTTSKGGTYEVPVTFTNGCQEGYAYDVFLKFTATTIEPTATISAWEDGDDVEVTL